MITPSPQQKVYDNQINYSKYKFKNKQKELTKKHEKVAERTPQNVPCRCPKCFEETGKWYIFHQYRAGGTDSGIFEEGLDDFPIIGAIPALCKFHQKIKDSK